MSEIEGRDDEVDTGLYEIRIKGLLDDRWAEWLGGTGLTHEADGTTFLTGRVADQAALYRVLRKVRDLGMGLLSVSYKEPEWDAPAEIEQQSNQDDGVHPTKGEST